MAPSSPDSPKDPLLGAQSKLTDNNPSSPYSSPTPRTAIKVLHLLRIATGLACLIAPQYTCALFKYHVPVEQALLVRMFGVREVVFGELLASAEDKDAADGGKR